MESLQNIKSRLRAVRNIGQITKAMEVVSATKMRKSQEAALRTRPYAFKALELLEKLSRSAPMETALTKAREVKNTLLVVVASDRGLAGAFNTQVLRKVEIIYDRGLSQHFIFAAVGKKAEKFLTKKGLSLVASFHGFGDFVAPEEIEPLADLIITGYEQGKWDRVLTLSMHFRTALKQEVLTRQILPVDLEKIRETIKEIVPEHGRYAENYDANTRTNANRRIANSPEYLFEPTAKETLELLIPHLVKMQIYHLVLEANASEHSSRRVAMKSASDSADELFQSFTLQHNRARQSGITKEMVEISATSAALT